jgi:hypothetical protein
MKWNLCGVGEHEAEREDIHGDEDSRIGMGSAGWHLAPRMVCTRRAEGELFELCSWRLRRMGAYGSGPNPADTN